MVRDFEQWNASIGEHGLVSELSGTRLGIEAADYIRKRIFNHPHEKEPLVPALGGLPIALEKQVTDDLKALEKLNIEPRFVFSGLDITDQEEPFRQKQEQVTVNANAWNLYDNHQAEASVAKFGESSERALTYDTLHGTDYCQPMSPQRTSFPRYSPSLLRTSFALRSHPIAHGHRYGHA